MFEYTPEAIRANVRTLILGRKIEMHRQVNSTNDLAKEAGRRGEPEGLVVLAEEQVRGRGRMGRTWSAPSGSSVLCSVLLRPRFSPEQAFYLTIAAALAIYRTVDGGRWTVDNEAASIPHSAFRIPHSIKWPNDVLVNGRKVSGVLSESEFVGGEWAFAVVGFGINVNLKNTELEELRWVAPQSTSLSAEWGAEIDRAALVGRVLTELEGLYLLMQNGQFAPIYDEWAAALETVGRRVSVDCGSGPVSGQALRVGSDGSLVIRTDSGTELSVLAGDVVR
jgi:BirA family biotin operon repressor/biotin-[acetyl-CoA-carboxylase] ligase